MMLLEKGCRSNFDPDFIKGC